MFDERSEEFVIPPAGDGEQAFGRGYRRFVQLFGEKKLGAEGEKV